MQLTLNFRPISDIPDDVLDAVVMGGEMDSGMKLRPYSLTEAWRDDAGRWWIGRSCEIEIIAPTQWAPIPD